MKTHQAGMGLEEPTSITGQQLATPGIYTGICKMHGAAKVTFSSNHAGFRDGI